MIKNERGCVCVSYMFWIIEYTDYYYLFGVSDLLRNILFYLAYVLKLLVDAVETLYKLSYRMYEFIASPEAIAIITEYKVFIVTGLAIAMLVLGFNIMIQNSEIVSKGIHKTVLQNMLLLVVVLVLIPIALIGESPMTGLTGTIGGSTFADYFEGADPAIYTSTAGSSSTAGTTVSQTDKCAADALVDIDYLLFSQGWVNSSPGSICAESDFNAIKNRFVANSNENGAFQYIKSNINKRISAAKIGRIKDGDTYNGGPLYKNAGCVIGGMAMAYTDSGVPVNTAECEDKFWKVFLEHHWTYDTGSTPLYQGTYYNPKVLNTFDGEVPYNIHVDWLQLYLSLFVVGIFMFVTAYKVIKLIIQLFWNFIITALIAPADITNGRRIKEIIMGTLGIVISLWFTGVTYQVFDAARDFINNHSSWFNYNSIAKNLMLLFFALALMEGPNLLQRILGVDAGLARSGAALAGAAMVGKHLVSAPINTAKKVAHTAGKVAGGVATAPFKAAKSIDNAREAKLSKNGIHRGDNDIGKSAKQMLNENKDSIKAQKEQRRDDFFHNGGKKLTGEKREAYEQRAAERRGRVASEQMQKKMQNETDNNQAKADILHNNPQQAEQYVTSRDNARIAEKEATLASHKNDNRNLRREASLDMQAGTLENNAKVQAMRNDPQVAQAYEGSKDDVRIAGKVASVTGAKSDDRMARETMIDMSKARSQNIAQAKVMNNNPQLAQNYVGSKQQANLAEKQAQVAYNDSSEGKNALVDNAIVNMQTNAQENEAMTQAVQASPELANAVASANLVKDSYQTQVKADAYQNNPEAVQRIVSSEKRINEMAKSNEGNLPQTETTMKTGFSSNPSENKSHFDRATMTVTLNGNTYKANYRGSMPIKDIMKKKNSGSSKLGGKE